MKVLSQALEMLDQLIATPSVNPRLATCGEPQGEQPLTHWLARFAKGQGWRWALQPVHADRDNFLAVIPGNRGDVLLWEVHQDTVSSVGMTVEPFRAAHRDGRIYGRGACDVKGPMAAMLTALQAASKTPPNNRPAIVLACSLNEECGFTGARALADIWRSHGNHASAVEVHAEGGLTLEEIQKPRPKAAIVAEPTDMNIVVAHRGVVRWQCTVHGRAAHSSRPEAGVNAIYGMTRVVQAIERYHAVELAALPADPLCGPEAACVTTIHGGAGPNTVPDRVVIDVDRRLRPGQAPETAYRELLDHVAANVELNECRIEHDQPWMQSPGLPRGANEAWAERLAEMLRGMGINAEIRGALYGADAASIAAAGIPTVVFGPGSIAQAHTADEWIAEAELARGVEAYYRIAMGDVDALM